MIYLADFFNLLYKEAYANSPVINPISVRPPDGAATDKEGQHNGTTPPHTGAITHEQNSMDEKYQNVHSNTHEAGASEQNNLSQNDGPSPVDASKALSSLPNGHADTGSNIDIGVNHASGAVSTGVDKSTGVGVGTGANAGTTADEVSTTGVGVTTGRDSARGNSESSGTIGANEEANEEAIHPMNHNIPDLQVTNEVGTLSSEKVKDSYRRLAKSYLTSFKNGIYRQLYFDILRRRTYALTPPGANKGIQSMLFQIIDGKVYLMDPYEVPRNSKPFYRTRINEVIWLLSKLAGEGRIKNTEFLVSIHDCVQTVNKGHTYRGAHFQESNPSFTIVSCNFSDNIPFPMWEGSKHRDGGFSSWDEQMKVYAQDDIPWDKKNNQAVFRGGNRPSMYFRNKSDADEHCHDVGRTRLKYLAEQQPELMDVSIGGSCGGVHSSLSRLEPKEHHKFKYILYAEGNCMWADRTRLQVFGPSVLIKQETPCGQFFEPLLKPFTHYIPTDFFFSDTINRIQWAKTHDEDAQQIVKNANEFAQNFLTLKGIETYVEVLLQEYTALLVEPEIKLENGATDVTNKQV